MERRLESTWRIKELDNIVVYAVLVLNIGQERLTDDYIC